MKNLIVKIMLLTSLFGVFGCKGSNDPTNWDSKKIDQWFEKGEWLNGWTVSPDASINRKEFAISYFKNKERWDRLFTFLKTNDLKNLEVKKYELEGANLSVIVSEYLSKDVDSARFEAHKNYIDLQYVISGSELMGVAPLSETKEITKPYDPAKDVEFMTVNKCDDIKATPEKFFILFPSDIHRPGLKDGENAPIKKLVGKIKVD
ncbi:MAG TPA: YhcH/YjgK/YiaL family protein [Bacteroidales bacterium]|nr:YhcH/YjgK/YiaL family protein [Bacteroidales bacterium]HPT22528.1 YhcH/YjgK/YiaL family protein [Bacteroidales bacterium]